MAEMLKKHIKVIPDWPKKVKVASYGRQYSHENANVLKGIMFQDILPILANPVAFEAVIADLIVHVTSSKTLPLPDVIVALDARGFLFGPTLATRLACSFVAVRKKGKLPGECISARYEKEYGFDEFEMQKGSIKPGQKVYIVDDLIATGGSANAAYDLVKQCGGEVVEFLFLIDLFELGGSKKLPAPSYAILKVEGE